MQSYDDRTRAVTVLSKDTVIRNKDTVLILDQHLCIVITEWNNLGTAAVHKAAR